jgi:hypothetical protein
MSNQTITRLIVGERITLSMGVAVTQGGAPSKSALTWANGRWESGNGIGERIKQYVAGWKTEKGQGPSLNLQAAPAQAVAEKTAPPGRIRKWGKNVALATLPVALVIAGYVVYPSIKGSKDALAVIPNAAGGDKSGKIEAINAVDAPWIRPAPERTEGDSQAHTPIPAETPNSVPVIVENRAVTPSAPMVVADTPQRPAPPPSAPMPPTAQMPKPVLAQPPVQAPAPAQAAPQAAKPAPDKKGPSFEAVILDVDPTGAKPKETASAPGTSAKPTEKEAPKRPTGAGLVAITQDGKAALFTNPTNKLPEKYSVGQKLPSGEVLRSIDVSTGTVKTDTKDYHLE